MGQSLRAPPEARQQGEPRGGAPKKGSAALFYGGIVESENEEEEGGQGDAPQGEGAHSRLPVQAQGQTQKPGGG